MGKEGKCSAVEQFHHESSPLVREQEHHSEQQVKKMPAFTKYNKYKFSKILHLPKF